MIQLRKLFFFVLYVLLFAIVSFRLKIWLFGTEDSWIFLGQTALFSLIFGIYLWIETFAATFHLYLQVAHSSSRGNLFWAFGAETILSLVAFYGFGAYAKFALWSLLIDPVVFFLAVTIIFQWVRSLSLSGLLSGNILWISRNENFDLSNKWLQDHHKSKKFFYVDAKQFSERDLDFLIVDNHINEVVVIESDLDEVILAGTVDFLQKRKIGYFTVANLKFWRPDGTYDLRLLSRGYTNHDSLLNISLKRIFDLVVSTLALGLLFPTFVLIGLLIKLDDKGPVFYVSRRVGKKGRIIRFMKFRSMVADAEKLKAALMDQNDRSGGPLFKMKNDPRITKIGRVLRKYSLDELPQLINVFRGELSLVGPRPHLESEVAHYEGYDFQRMDCIPGITCFAQIKDRNGTSFREWIDLDLKYRNEWNFLLDLNILIRTVRVVLAPLQQKIRGESVDIF